MPEKDRNKTQHLKKIDSRNLPVRLALAAVIVSAIAFGWFTVRWQFGNMLAGVTLPTQPNAKQIAQTAKNFAPSDPLTSWLLARISKDVFPPENLEQALRHVEQAVRLAPNDFRWWVELGRVYEQTEQPEKAETAYLRGVELAPTYTYPHWQLGNFYLRQNRTGEAFTELKKAAADNDVYRQQVFSIAWEFYEQDTAQLEAIAGELPDSKAGLAKFYALKGRAEESLRVWNTLSAQEKQQNELVAKLVARVLYDKGFLLSAVQFINQIGIESNVTAETVHNGGFEEKIEDKPETVYFGWKIEKAEKLTVKLDPSRQHSETRSLRLTFNGYIAPQLYNVTQVVVTKPGKKYRLSFWLKTEELKTAGAPVLEIINAKTAVGIAASKPFTNGTNDWQQITLDFTAPEDAEGVIIRTARSFCGDGCPIVGNVWYDDFELKTQ